jgi:PAS domain S-box-containing protein
MTEETDQPIRGARLRRGLALVAACGAGGLLLRAIDLLDGGMRLDLFALTLMLCGIGLATYSSMRARALRHHADQLGDAQRRLREAELKYRNLVETVPAVIYVDEPGDPWHTTYISPRVEALLGFTSEEFLGDQGLWARQIHAEDRELVIARTAEQAATGGSSELEYRIFTRDGELRWVSDRSEIVHDQDGEHIYTQGVIVDITRKRALHARLRVLLSAVTNATDAVMVTEADGLDDPEGPKVVYVNDAFTRITGFTAEEVIGNHTGILRGPGTSFEDLRRLNERISRGESGTLEILNYRKDGSAHWIEISVTPVKDEAGRITHYVSIQRDITPRKAEEARLEALMRNLDDVVWIVDASGEIRYRSPSITRVLGYQIDERDRKGPFDLIHPDDLPRAERVLSTLLVGPGEHDLGVWRIRHKDGRWRQLQVHSSNLINDPDIRGIVVTGHDITLRVEVEETLREAESRFRSAFDNAPFGMALIEPAGDLLQVNRSLCTLLGLSEAELLTMTCAEIIADDDLPSLDLAIDQLLKAETETAHPRGTCIRRDGTGVPVEIYISLVRSAAGEPQYVVMQIEDVTERSRLEERLRQSQKLEAVGQLAGGIAHDFNNLLSVIQSYARFLTEELTPGSPEAEDAQEIVRAGERAADLVRRLLAFSRRDGTTASVVNVNEAIAELDRLLRRTIGEDIELVTKLGNESWWTRIDPGNLEQVMMNLAFNARDAMPQGGHLTITTGTKQVEETAELAAGTYASIVVADTGLGMSAEVMDRIFEPFYTTKSRGRGTGLGLATVYGIVVHAAGTINVSSAPGRGSRFEILLPAIDHEPDDERAPQVAAPARGNREKILVVEDEEAVRQLVQRILERNGYEVVVAASGSEALEICGRSDGVSLLLTDVIMPQMSGRDLAQQLMLKSPLTRVVFMSGYPGETLANHGISEGDRSYLQKPFTKEQLLDRVRNALDSEPHPVRS